MWTEPDHVGLPGDDVVVADARGCSMHPYENLVVTRDRAIDLVRERPSSMTRTNRTLAVGVPRSAVSAPCPGARVNSTPRWTASGPASAPALQHANAIQGTHLKAIVPKRLLSLGARITGLIAADLSQSIQPTHRVAGRVRGRSTSLSPRAARGASQPGRHHLRISPWARASTS